MQIAHKPQGKTTGAPRAGLRPPRRMRICIYPGTFDPVTNGHLDVVTRAAHMFDKIIMAVAANPGKEPLFTAAERMQLIAGNLAPLPNVEVGSFDGLLVEYARQRGAVAIIRGLRALSDFEFEFQMALMNRHLDSGIETIFVMTKDAYSYTSSRMVKQVSRYGADIAPFVPPNVAAALKLRKASPSAE
jgi:pantetheine-phosphate adenylyltransferase